MGGKLSKRKKGYDVSDPKDKTEEAAPGEQTEGQEVGDPSAAGEVKPEPLVSAQAANGSTAAEPEVKPEPLVSAQAANGSTAAEPAEKPAQPAMVVSADPALPQEAPQATATEAITVESSEVQTQTPAAPEEPKVEETSPVAVASLPASEPQASVTEAVKEEVNEAQKELAAVAEESVPPVLSKETKPEDPPTKSEPSLSAPEVALPLASVVEAVRQEVNEAQKELAAVAEESVPPVLSKETKPEDPPTKSEPSLSAPEVALPLASVVEAVKQEVNEAQKELAAVAEESVPPVLSKEPKPEEPSTKSKASLPKSKSPAVENPDESVVAQEATLGAQEDPVSEISVTPVKKVITNSTTEPAAVVPTDSEKIILEQATPESGGVIQPEEVDVTEESSAEMGDQATRPNADLVQEPESVTKSKAEEEPKTEIPEPLPVESPTPVLESPSAVPSAGEPQIHTEIPVPTTARLEDTQEEPLKSGPAAESREGRLETEVEEQSEPAEQAESAEHPRPDEEKETTPGFQASTGTPSKCPKGAEEPCRPSMMEPVPEIIISESISTGEFLGDEAAESTEELKKVADSPGETCQQEAAAPQPTASEDGMGGDGRTVSKDGKAENRECNIADTEGETKPPSLGSGEENLEQATEPAVQKRTEPQQEECVSGLSKAREQNGINNCELQTDLMGEIADAIGDTVNQVVDLV